MFRKLHTTGLNKFHRTLAVLVAILMLFSMPIVAAAENGIEYAIEVSGFSLDFDADDNYYLVNPSDFTNCRITGFKGFKSIAVSVEQYEGYKPYTSKAYVLGEPLALGYGRAKLTIVATLPDDTTLSYLICLTDPRAAENSYAKVVVNTDIALRAEPNTTSAVLTRVQKGTTVYYLGTEGDWAHIQYGSKVGWIKDTAEENYIRWNWEETAIPAQYEAQINALKAAHPNWTFTFVDTELTYAEAKELYGNCTVEGVDRLNPANYLNEYQIFAFLDIDTYDPTLWNDEGIKKIWQNETMFSKDEVLGLIKTTSESIQMNPYYIACRMALESSYGASRYASGNSVAKNVTIENNVVVNGISYSKGTYYETLDLGETYYNFFGIGAYNRNPDWCILYAGNRGWNTKEKAIVEGSNWIKDQYLDRGSVTPYFFRFASFKRQFQSGHSYMTDLKAPWTEASILRRAYADDPDAKAHFIIPVYRSENYFADLDPTEWYYEETMAAIEAKLFNGMTETEFKPNENMTRAQFVTALSRLCGVDVSSYETDKFADVKKDDWYYRYVAWATQTGVTEGVSADRFAPDKEITRQEMCKMMGTAIEKLLGHTLTTTSSSAFKDQASIADWAKEWVEKCYNAGIFKGDDQGNFNPEAKARRCEAACVFYRCSEKYV